MNEMVCPECGAIIPEGKICRDYLDAFLVLEFSDPAYFAVHHLTVPAYMVQHPGQLSRDGWREMRRMLADFLREDVPPALYRRDRRADLDGGQRDFRFRKGEPMALPETLVWTRTIADVRAADPATYCAHIKQWAEAVFATTAEIPV